MRRTKMVVTLGPATDEVEVLRGLISAGADVVRLNAAHSGPSELAARIAGVRAAASEAGREVGVLLDLPGPKVRIGEVEDGVVLQPGAPFTLVATEITGDAARASVSHPRLAQDVERGDRILIDDGRIELVVRSVAGDEVHTEVVSGGPLVSRKGVNVPLRTLSVDAITRYDTTLLAWAQSNEIDWIGQSFVRSAGDVVNLRGLMTTRKIPIVAKIEKHEAADAIDSIIAAADAVMVARGDLGVETSPERVPVLQRRIVSAARGAGKPVIIATEMLDSMRVRPRPTRAEASDVANAVFGWADALMLSGETAVGEYPVLAAQTMCRIVEEAEAASTLPQPPRGTGGDDVQTAITAAASELAEELDLAAIVTLTQSGATASAVSRFRPATPILAVTPHAQTARTLSVVWGVHSLTMPFPDDTADLLDMVAANLVSEGAAQPGQRIAITAGLNVRESGRTDFLHVRTV